MGDDLVLRFKCRSLRTDGLGGGREVLPRFVEFARRLGDLRTSDKAFEIALLLRIEVVRRGARPSPRLPSSSVWHLAVDFLGRGASNDRAKAEAR